MAAPDPDELQPRRPTKNDLELQERKQSGEFWRIIAWGVAVSGCIVASSLPLLFVYWIFEAIAGKETIVNANVQLVVSVGVTVALSATSAGATWAVTRKKMNRQAEELKRMRIEREMLEKEIDALKNPTRKGQQ